MYQPQVRRLNINNYDIMNYDTSNDAMIYVAPKISVTEISVEKGFAQSGEESYGFTAPDYGYGFEF